MEKTIKSTSIKICLLGDFSEEVLAHKAINLSLPMVYEKYGKFISFQWVRTRDIEKNVEIQFANYNAVWCVPASPYENMDGVLDVIHYVRLNNIPFLGTCGGYQHALVEYAKNQLLIADANHAEENTDSKSLIVTPLACSLIEQSEIITIKRETLLHEILKVDNIEVLYHCSFGFNKYYLSQFESQVFKFTAFNSDGDVRAFELSNHPYFICTAFQPERAAFQGILHPIIDNLISSAIKST